MLAYSNTAPIVVRVPSSGTLGFSEGYHMAQHAILPMLDALSGGTQQLQLVIPYERSIERAHPFDTATCGFFVGLLQDVLLTVRNNSFPHLGTKKPYEEIDEANICDHMWGVGTGDFVKAMLACEPIRIAFWDKVSVGLDCGETPILLAKNHSAFLYAQNLGLQVGRLAHWVADVDEVLTYCFTRELRGLQPRRPGSATRCGCCPSKPAPV